MVILLVALIVLGPTKLPEAARKIGEAMNELRRMTSGFQAELRDALEASEIDRTARSKDSPETREPSFVEGAHTNSSNEADLSITGKETQTSSDVDDLSSS